MREQKGQSLLDFPNDCTVIDLETTGLSPEWDDIIELSALKIRNGKIIDSYSSLVHSPDVYVDEYITGLTGITQEMVDDAPEIFDILPKYFSFIGNDILIGHNINFDINFLYDKSLVFCNAPVSNDFVDTMRLSRRLHPEEPHHRLKDLVKRYSLDYTGSHRAEQDCHITLKVYKELEKEIIEKYGNTNDFIISLKKKHSHSKAFKATDIYSENTEFDVSHPLYGKVCVFTGTLEKMIRKEAMQLIVNLGGINGDGVTKKTNFLILGNNDYCKTIKDGKSLKQKKAEKLKAEGQDIEIIPENVFYDMISENYQDCISANYLENPSNLLTTFEDNLQNLLDELIILKELPQKSLHIFSNKSSTGANAGTETSKSICIYEPDYPSTKIDIDNPGKNSVVLNIQVDKHIELLIRRYQFESLEAPASATIKKVASDATFIHVLFDFNDNNIIPYIKDNILYCLSRYSSKAKTFGCCSKFTDCSDAKKCLHENKLYSTACSYRHNLEAGRIFYGKNKNI